MMNAITNEDLTAYVFGDSTDACAMEIRRRMAEDREFAAKVEVCQSLFGMPPPKEIGPQRFQRRNKSIRWILQTAALVVSCCLLLGAGWLVLLERPLLVDDFDDHWFNSSLWKNPPLAAPDMGVLEDGGVMHLVNRGYLVTQAEFSRPYTIEFDWKWQREGLEPTYAEHLTIAIRTTGVPQLKSSHEAQDGVLIKCNSWGGYINSVTAENVHIDIASTNSAVLPMPPDGWMTIRITDTGNRVKVFAAPRDSPSSAMKKPLLDFNCEYQSGGHHIAIYNREKVSVRNESMIDNVKIVRFSPGDN